MATRKVRQNNGNRRSKRKNQNRRRRIQRSRGSRSTQPSLGRLFASGVKNVISLFPGATVLGKVADIVFKGLGLTDASLGDSFEGDVEVFGMMTVFTISLVNIVGNSRAVATSVSGAEGSFSTPYRRGRLVSLDITFKPDGVISSRAGQVLFGFQPFVDETDVASWTGAALNQWPTERGIRSMYMSRIGPATETMTMRFVPNPTHGLVYQPHDLEDGIGVVVLRYENYNRAAYHEFTPADFEASIIIKGRVELRNPYPGVYGPATSNAATFVDKVQDELVNASFQISKPDGTFLTLAKRVTSTPKGGVVTIKGRKLTSNDIVTRLKDFEMDDE